MSISFILRMMQGQSAVIPILPVRKASTAKWKGPEEGLRKESTGPRSGPRMNWESWTV